MQRLTILMIFCTFLSSCAPYLQQARPALDAYYRGDFERAAELADEIHPRKADKLLALMDKATIYHAASKYKKSIKFFTKAKRLAEKNQRVAILQEVGAVLTNDNLKRYVADPYERLLIHTYQIMNYAALGDLEGALVEVRQINTLYPDIFAEENKDSFMKSAFMAYLSGLIWEMNDLSNDAYIDYKRVDRLHLKPIGLADDIKRSAIEANLDKENQNNKKSPNLIVVIETGRAPEKVSSEYKNGLQIIPVPLYESYQESFRGANVKVDFKNRGEVSLLENIDGSLKAALEKKMPAIVARAIARLAAKEGAAVAVGETVNKDLGIFLGVLFLATNRADLRSWTTLPRSFYIWRGYITPGSHTISLDISPGSGKKLILAPQNLNMVHNGKRLVVFRIF